MFTYSIVNRVLHIYRDGLLIETITGVEEDDERLGMYLDDAVFAHC